MIHTCEFKIREISEISGSKEFFGLEVALAVQVVGDGA